MELRFTLNGTVFPNPLNWQDLRIRKVKDPDIWGFYATFSSELKFSGVSYDYIYSEYLTDPCGLIETVVESRCGIYDSWTTVFEGNIILENSKFDFAKCFALCTIEEAGCAANFLKNIEMEVNPYSATSISGQGSFTNFAREITNIQMRDQTYYTPKQFMWNVFEMLEYIAKVITGDCIEVRSTFLETDYKPCIMQFKFTANPANGDTIYLKVRNPISQDTAKYEVKVDTLRDYYGDFYNVFHLEYNPGSRPYSPAQGFDNQAFFVKRTAGPPDTFLIYFHAPMEIDSYSFGTGTGTCTVTQDWQDGGSQLHFADGENFFGVTVSSRAKTFNFLDIFKFLAKQYSLGFYLETIAGVTTLWIKHISELMVDSGIAIEGIRNITREPLPEASAGNYMIYPEFVEGPQTPYIAPYTYNVPADFEYQDPFYQQVFTSPAFPCNNTIDMRTPSKYYNLFGAKMDAMATGFADYNDTLFFTYADNTSPAPFYGFRWELVDITGTIIRFTTIQNWIAQGFYSLWRKRNLLPAMKKYFVQITYFEQQIDYLNKYDAGYSYSFSIPGPDKEQPEGELFARYDWTFEKFITRAEFQALIGSVRLQVNETTDPLNAVDGWIKEMEYRIFDGWTRFVIAAKG